MTPAEKAARLRAAFGPEKLARTIAIWAHAAGTLSDPDRAAFWGQVAAELSGE